MKVPQIAVLLKPQPLKAPSLTAVERSLKRAGYRTRLTYDETAPEDIIVAWSWGRSQIARAKNPDAIILTLDHGYTKDRGKLINTGWSVPGIGTGLNGFAEHAWVDDGGDRARSFGLYGELEPPKSYNDCRALLLGQVYGDAMVRGQVTDYKKWLRTLSDDLAARGWKVTFRPHPVMVRRGQALEYGNLGRQSAYNSLWDDLSLTDRAVALNSNGLVTAFIDGVPVEWYNKGTMLSPLEGLTDKERWDIREAWLNRLAWTQWTLEELEDGTWVKYHAPIMHRLVEEGTIVPWHERKIT